MAKDKTKKKLRTGFFKEFKEFISRGNVLDMAVGVIVGGAFTAIVTALTSQILQPLVNWVIALIVGGDGLEAAVTVLRAAYVVDELGAYVMQNGERVIDLANSIYINWGAFITAIINFFLIAIILFCIVKIINSIRARAEALKTKLATKNEEETAEEATTEEPVAEEPAPAPAPTTEELLTQIRDLLAAQNEKKE